MNDSAKSWAQHAYSDIIEQIAERQQNIVMRRLLRETFGAEALPLTKFERRITPRNQTLANASATNERMEAMERESLAKLIEQARELEAIFVKYYEAEDDAWATGVADYLRKSRKRD